jgi:hypothetical protein
VGIADRKREEAERERQHQNVHHWSAPVAPILVANNHLRISARSFAIDQRWISSAILLLTVVLRSLPVRA